jgi:hypothetical protein
LVCVGVMYKVRWNLGASCIFVKVWGKAGLDVVCKV